MRRSNGKKIIIIFLIALLIFSAGFGTAYLIGRYEHERTITEYESRYLILTESIDRKNIIISNLGTTLGEVEEGLRKREALDKEREKSDRAREAEIRGYEEVIRRLVAGGGSESESLDRLELYNNEVIRRIQSITEE